LLSSEVVKAQRLGFEAVNHGKRLAINQSSGVSTPARWRCSLSQDTSAQPADTHPRRPLSWLFKPVAALVEMLAGDGTAWCGFDQLRLLVRSFGLPAADCTASFAGRDPPVPRKCFHENS
jgi:hypothetical protein